jgi:hypothetical protein
MAEVLGVAELLDAQGDSDYEQADPYVVAMAWDIREHYSSSQIVVVSDDVIDRLPRKESVKTACERLNLECWRTPDFVAHVRVAVALPTG